MASKDCVIRILNFRKYQSREVKSRTIWLRLQNDFIENPNFAEFSSDERIAWLHILCCASRLNQDTLQVPHQCSHRVLSRCTGIDEKVFYRAIQKLKQLKILEVRTTRGRYALDTFANADDTHLSPYEDETRRNETRRDGTETERDDAKPTLPPLAEIWNRNRGPLAEVKGCSGKRKTSATERWEENPSTEYWSEIVTRMAGSAFCRGEKNQPGAHSSWKADFDFLIRPDTQHKVREGKYDDRGGPSPADKKRQAELDAVDRELAEARIRAGMGAA